MTEKGIEERPRRLGVIDEEYAIAMEGARLMDAFFGYREGINIFREARAHDGKMSDGATGAPPFANKLYYELQSVALRWHKKRSEEWSVLNEKIGAANREADRLRDEAQASGGVQPKAREALEERPKKRH